MDKSNFKKLALLGMAGGLLLGSAAPLAAESTEVEATILAKSCGSGCSGGRRTADAQDTVQQQKSGSYYSSGRMMTENELMSQLNEDGKSLYRGLDADGKAQALKLASQPEYKDKNEAVRAASRQMADKRAGMNKGNTSYYQSQNGTYSNSGYNNSNY